MSSERLQSEHYDAFFDRYEAHYDDPTSRRYRRKFIDEPMFRGIDLAGKDVLEAMCGSGQTTEYLLAKGARVTGLDVSSEAIKSFTANWPTSRALCASVLDTKLASESFDAVVVVGGLHHLHPHLREGVTEIHRILKKGGYFCFMEPHAGSFSDVARKQWYKRDDLFAANESAVDVERLRRDFSSHFAFLFEKYFGNLAYLLVLNSMVFRIPIRMKRFYAPALMRMESMIAPLQGRLLSCCVICRWQKS